MEQCSTDYRTFIHSAPLSSGILCPDCKSTHYRKHGKHKGIQRFKCTQCDRTFKLTHNTAIHGIHKKELFIKYLKAIKQGMTIRKAAKYTGISVGTSFSWRHKLLSAIKIESTQDSPEVSVINQISLPYSEKGKRGAKTDRLKKSVSMMMYQKNTFRLKKLEWSKAPHARTLEIKSQIKQQLLITDSKELLFKRTVKNCNNNIIKDKSLKKYYIEKTDILKKKLLTWMEKFRGVATKYLQQYWNWFCIQEYSQNYKNEFEYLIENCSKHRNISSYRELRRK